ncbi:hypothetical protein Tco_0852923 [Tanacetum coccineum]
MFLSTPSSPSLPLSFSILTREMALTYLVTVTTGGVVNFALKRKRDMIIENLDLEPKINAMIKEAVESRKLAHLVKYFQQGNQRNKGQGWGRVKVINMVSSEGNQKRPYEGVELRLTNKIAFLAIPQGHLIDSQIMLEAMIEGFKCAYEVNVEKVKCIIDRIFKRSLSPFGIGGPPSDNGRAG